MDKQEVTLEMVVRQEQTLQFSSFSNEMALELGNLIVEMARAAQQAVAVDITRNGTMLFFHGMTGTTKDNADWIRRKSNLVNRTGHASFYTNIDVKRRGGDVDAIATLDARDYAAHGGAFPLVVKDVGQVGTITVSGLPGAEDHALVVRALRRYLKVDADAGA